MASKRDLGQFELAEKLDSWSNKHGVSKDLFVVKLVSALRESTNLHIFAQMDPIQYLPVLEAKVSERALKRVRLITVLRNTLVFAPVALTWAAVNVATTSFSKYVAENPNSVSNFLDFWQNGYGYLPGHWKIASVAALDFMIILVVIFFTIYVSIAGQRLSDQREVKQAKLDSERIEMAMEILLVLEDKKKITPANFNKSIAGSAARLVSATKEFERAAKIITKAQRA